jgi:succinate dehydrogenase/fumarate reductase cytochrome b subunit
MHPIYPNVQSNILALSRLHHAIPYTHLSLGFTLIVLHRLHGVVFRLFFLMHVTQKLQQLAQNYKTYDDGTHAEIYQP